MGMSTHVSGIRALDGRFKKMIEAKLVCEMAGVSYPKEVEDYFGDEVGESQEYLMENAREVDLGEALSDWNDGNMREGYSVDVTKLPEGVTEILFYNAY